MRTALAKVGVGLTALDIAFLELPHILAEHHDTIIWEFTGFPYWWAMRDDEWHPVHTFRRQLREFRDGQATRTVGATP